MAVHQVTVHRPHPFVNAGSVVIIGAMRVFGLTGGIASGKSTVARMFEEEGIPVVDADQIAKKVTAPGRPAHAQIVRLFGPEILLPGGEIDRRKLRDIIFADPAKRAALEAVTHPRIARGIAQALARLASRGHPLALVEAALIHEKGPPTLCEAVIAVRCERNQQVERLLARDGIAREQATQRIEAQMDPEEKARASDYVIDNSGSLEETRRRVRTLAARLKKRAATSKGAPPPRRRTGRAPAPPRGR